MDGEGLGSSPVTRRSECWIGALLEHDDADVPAILVLCGETTREQAESAQPAPDLVVTDTGELSRLLIMARRKGRTDEAANG